MQIDVRFISILGVQVYVVTVCYRKRNPNHDPTNKQTGACIVSPHCTDVIGQHHSYVSPLSEAEIKDAWIDHPDVRLTRIELA